MVDWSKHESLLADLKSEQKKLQSAINAIEALRPEQVTETAVDIPVAPAGPWAGVATADAAKHVLQENPNKAWAVSDLFEILEKNGVNVANANILSSILSRRAKEKGDIFRVGRGMWTGDSPAAREMTAPVDDDDDFSL